VAASKVPTVNVGLIGLGTVGTGVARILKEKRAALRARTGFDFRLKTVCVRHPRKARRVALGDTRLTADPRDILEDPSIDQVVELIGGLRPAYGILRTALLRGKDVISANKALFAERGTGLWRLAQKTRRHIGLEASVGGGIPVIKALREGLASNRIHSVHGILNGTCNTILTEMSLRNRSYSDALREAQERGYAEQNPLLDVDGTDTAHKLAILARIAFQRDVDFRAIFCEGIAGLALDDIAYCLRIGYVTKLLAIARRVAGGRLELRVHPTLLPRDHLLANINGVNNAILVKGDEVDDVLFYGKGAGERPTASAVVSDMIDIAKLRNLDIAPDLAVLKRARVLPMSEVASRYYLRFLVEDRPGTLGRLTRILGDHGISIASVHQDELPRAPHVPVRMFTHSAVEKRLQAAVRRIDGLALVHRKTILIRVEG
jgi:homoserine dehydrogenase